MTNNDEATTKTFQVQDAARILEFEGQLLSDVSTETDSNPRWTEMELYRTINGQYVLCIIGRSVVYHAHAGRCNSGVPTPVAEMDSDLLDELEPCYKCNPPTDEELVTSVTIDLEEDRHAVHVCDTAKEVVAKLRNPKAAAGRTTGLISGPGQRLLGIASRVDQDIKDAATVVDRI